MRPGEPVDYAFRVIVQLVNHGAAAHVGGPTMTEHRTFAVEMPEVAELFGHIEEPGTYCDISIVGVAIERTPKAEGGAR